VVLVDDAVKSVTSSLLSRSSLEFPGTSLISIGNEK
jgi:hypothetical protein